MAPLDPHMPNPLDKDPLPPASVAVDDREPDAGDWRGDPLSGFPAEAEVTAAAARARKVRSLYLPAAGVAVLLAIVAAVFLVQRAWRGTGQLPATGTLTIQSSPPGVQVLEGGRELGLTPLTLTRAPGRHALVLRRGAAERPLSVDVPAGIAVVHHVEMGEAPQTGSLRVDSSARGATVEIDGTSRGATPLEVTDLAPGEHDVTVRSGESVAAQKVTIIAGGTASLLVPLAQAEVGAAGWLAVASPIDLQLYEGESLVGSSRMPRVMLPAGARTLRLVNAETGFETTAKVQIRAGAETRLPVKLPSGRVSVNAVPWAEVLIDGRRVGETPIANHSLQIGTHEIILRNPRYPEQRRTVVVSEATPVRVGVDLRQ